MSDFQLMLKDYRLTTAEILYHLPDHPSLLQTFVWQNLDIAPKFPVLGKFLLYWENEIEGKLHSVKIASTELITPAEFTFAKGELKIH
jgi:uncharacterized protein Usg